MDGEVESRIALIGRLIRLGRRRFESREVESGLSAEQPLAHGATIYPDRPPRGTHGYANAESQLLHYLNNNSLMAPNAAFTPPFFFFCCCSCSCCAAAAADDSSLAAGADDDACAVDTEADVDAGSGA